MFGTITLMTTGQIGLAVTHDSCDEGSDYDLLPENTRTL